MRLTAVLAVLLAALPAAAQTTPETETAAMTAVVIPVVGNTLGANDVRWKTDLELLNDQRTAVIVTIEMASPFGFVSYTMAPGETLRFPDIVGQVFGSEDALSPLIVRTNARRSVSIRASAYGVRGSETFPPHEIAISYRSTYFPSRILQGLVFSDDFRTNIGLVNLGTKEAEFVLALQRIRGRNLAVTRLTLPPNSLWHFSVQSAFPLVSKGDSFSVLVETPSPDTYVYGSVVANATNVARFIASDVSTPVTAQR